MGNQFQTFSSSLDPTTLYQPQVAATAQHQHQGNAPTPVQSLTIMQQLQAAGLSQQQIQQMQQMQQAQQQMQQTQQQMQQTQRPMTVPSQPRALQTPMAVSSQGPMARPTDQTFMLPSTMVPPTVLASVCKGTNTKKRPSPAPSKKKPAKKGKHKDTTPQDVLMRVVEQQGHGELTRIKSEDAGYDTMPSPLQLSSFGTQVVHAVHTNDDEMLGKLLDCGLSPNPCNQFRDSILDLVCKRNNVAIFKCLLEHGSDIRVVDGFGRTPLHHCAWASNFCREIAEAILERDPLQIFIEDKRGQTPMEYVRANIISDWTEFLEEMADKFWPKGQPVARLVRPKDSRPDGTLPDPMNSISAGLASMISSGNITPEQFSQMSDEAKKSYG
jgi:Ankyrin repeats (3 copies)